MRQYLALLLILFYLPLLPWGFQAHKTINLDAIFLLPDSLYQFYRPYAHQIEEWATKADQRRYIVAHEGAKHYIDLDYYEHSSPLDTIIKSWKQLLTHQAIDTTFEHGVLPWNILDVYSKLVRSFEQKDTQAIIRISADLGHYVADAHVPLHTTSNYNGQLSNQHGIHALWETRLPELYLANYDLLLPAAFYIQNVDSFVWKLIDESYSAKDSVLKLEAELATQALRFGYERKNGRTIKVYNKSFCEGYHQLLNGMVEKRLTKAIHAVASLWYSAWIDAHSNSLLQVSPLDSLLQKTPVIDGRVLLH